MLTKTLFAKSFCAVGLLGLALSASQPAFAGTRVVGYGDLDLSTKEGQARLDSRLRAAAKQVCDLKSPNLQRSEFESARKCYVKSLTDARRAKDDLRPRAVTAK
ncbi:UrcA family protein [Novosphingobium sp. ERN07]|uniref:UrcA family protein n=1 Tax=Novosphingobium sp. ERN07 TaxID=2726187 RepID=UPI00145655FD|nr:UrcA family protein [Novosphingobium sp. ERN07]NLR69524.1 UrcA family protein [Novosphingobium sp. ERN07]